MSQLKTIAKPVARAISIYRKLARHDLEANVRLGLAKHLRMLAEKGEQDPGRLTVHALSYLRSRDRIK